MPCSTNGTFVNDQKLGRNNKFELSHNDKIQLVKRPNQSSEDVVLMYQDLRQLEDEEYNLQENTEEWSSETDTTAELKDQTDSSHETEAEQTKAVAEPDSKILTTTEEKPKDTIGETLTCSICQLTAMYAFILFGLLFTVDGTFEGMSHLSSSSGANEQKSYN